MNSPESRDAGPSLQAGMVKGLREAESAHAQRVSLALAAGNTGVWSWDPRTEATQWDERVGRIWGVPETMAPKTADFVQSVHAEDRDKVQRALSSMLESGSSAGGESEDDFEFRIHRFDDGKERWIAARGQVFHDTLGSVVEVIGTVRDVTEQKLHDIHLHMLLREITHRSKNLLAIIQAMARQTVKDSLTAADFEFRLSHRIKGLAASHELLAAQDWHGAHIEELVKGQLGNVIERFGSRLAIDGPSLFVKPEAAQNIGLALNELASNAVRFGALSNDDGGVSISWSLDGPDIESRRLHFMWSESGGPAVAPPQRHGFGHKVVERVAARALDGSVSLTFAPSGLQWSLHIPISFVLTGQPASIAGMTRFF